MHKLTFVKYEYMIKCSAELEPMAKIGKSLLFIHLEW